MGAKKRVVGQGGYTRLITTLILNVTPEFQYTTNYKPLLETKHADLFIKCLIA